MDSGHNNINSRAFDKSKLYARVTELDDTSVLNVYQSEVGDVGCVVWDAAIVLGKFYEHILLYHHHHQLNNLVEDKDRQLRVTPEGDWPEDSPSSGNSAESRCIRCCRSVAAAHVNAEIIYELGSGTGYVGLIAAALGAREVTRLKLPKIYLCCRGNVIITDLPEFEALLQYNIDINHDVLNAKGGKISAIPHVWGDEGATPKNKPKVILMADCIYYEQSLGPLVDTLVSLSDDNTLIICCHEERTTDNKPKLQKEFFERIGEKFAVVKVPASLQHSTFNSSDIHIHFFKKRQDPP